MERATRKVRVGIVVSDGRDKTVTVEVRDTKRHPGTARPSRLGRSSTPTTRPTRPTSVTPCASSRPAR